MDVQACSSGRLLSRRDVAKLLGVAEGTLAHWAAAGTGPAFARSGPVRGRVWYAEADVMAWVLERRQACGGIAATESTPPSMGAGCGSSCVPRENQQL